MRYPDYPSITGPLSLTDIIPGWVGGRAVRIEVAQLFEFFTGADGDLSGLIAALAGEIADREAAITALQAKIDDLSSFAFPVGFIGPTPAAAELISQIDFPFAVTFPANFSLNVGHLRGAAPSASIFFTIKQLLADGTDNGEVGRLTIAMNKALTWTTTSGSGFVSPLGSCLQMFAPADSKGATNLSAWLIGTRTL